MDTIAISGIESNDGRIITREEVIDAYRKFVARGIKNPDDLDVNDPEVDNANNLFFDWIKQEDQKIGIDPELVHRINLSKTMFYPDAGFTDSTYLSEVLGWIINDATYVVKQNDNLERIETRRQLAEAIKRIRKLINGIV